MILIYLLTIWTGKFLVLLLRLSNRGSATALPGLIAEKFPGNILKFLSKQITHKIIVTGTNGKTTTQTLISSILRESGIDFISNSSGSNLKRGLISKLIAESSMWGQINSKYAVFEIEEATLPKIVNDISPQVIIVTNLFRDQLDAYGEIDRTQKFIKHAIDLSPNSTVILNSDDPRVFELGKNIPNKILYFSIEENESKKIKYEGESKKYKDFEFEAKDIKINNDLSTTFKINSSEIRLQTTGKFHAYNALAAYLGTLEIEVSEEKIIKGLSSAKPAFGRGEVINVNDIEYKFLLVKNPAGLNLTIDILQNTINPTIIFMLNDKIADGRDVSWIWDSDFEKLNEINPKNIICSGERAEDLLLRIKYALNGLEKLSDNTYVSRQETKVIIEKDMNKIERILKKINAENETVFVLPTYTAMLEYRKILLGKSIS